MSIEIICDDCGNKYRVGDDKAGSRVRCKECGAKIDVPDDDFEEVAESRSRSTGKSRRKSNDGAPVGVIIGVGAIVVVVLIGVALFFTLGNRKPDVVAQGDPANAAPNANPNPAPPIPQNGAPAGNTQPNSGAPINAFPGAVGPGPQVANNNQPTNTLPGNAATTNGFPRLTQPNRQPGTGLPTTGLPKSLPRRNDAASKPPAKTETSNVPTTPQDGGGKDPVAAANGGFVPENDPFVDAPAPANWNVKVDPNKIDFKFDAAKPISMKMPNGGELKDIVFPMSSSPFVALGNNSNAKHVREIWNLATKQRIGSITGIVIDNFWAQASLSPDGQHLASAVGNPRNEVTVYTIKGKHLGNLDTGDKDGVRLVFFTSPTRLVTVGSNGSAKTWKIPSGEAEHDLQLGETRELYEVAVSPGGKYLASVTGKNVLQVFDLDTAEVAGDIAIPSEDHFWNFKTDGMSFSPDGIELALTGEVFSKGRYLLRYNVADGKLLARAVLSNEASGHSDQVKTNRLEWFPDRTRLLWKGHHVLDAKLGGPVWSAPAVQGSSDAPRKILDAQRIVMGIGGHQSPGLTSAPIPVKEIEAATKLVASGGIASDAGLPPISKSNYDEMLALAPIAANWSMQPDPAPADNTVKNAIALPKERPGVGGVFVSRPSVNRALVWYTDDALAIMHSKGMVRQVNIPDNLKGTCLIEAYDLAKGGKAVATLAVPYKSMVLDASLDGEHAVVRTSQPKDDRVDVYNVMTGKQIAGWRPFQQKEDFFKGITAAFILDGEYCLTQNFGGTTYMWKLPECKAVWQLKAARNLCVSPGGKYLGFLADNRYVFMDARKGEFVGEVPVVMPNIACAFHPMGTHIAITATDTVSRKITIMDVAKGEVTGDFFVPPGKEDPQSIQWCGDSQILLDNSFLIDLAQQKVAWRYITESAVHAKTQPDGRHWYVSSAGFNDPTITLSSVTIPEKAVADKISGTQLPDESLLKPGMQLNLLVNLGALPPDRPNLAQEVGTRFEAGLKANGFQIAAGAPYTLTITTTQVNTGKTAEFRGIGIGGNSTVPIVHINCEVALVANGQAAWKHTHTVVNTNGHFEVVSLEQGEDLTTHFAKRMWGNVANHLTKFPVPAQAFPASAEAGLGQSKFTVGGVQPVVGR